MGFLSSLSGILGSTGAAGAGSAAGGMSSLLGSAMGAAGSILGGLSAYEQSSKNAAHMAAMGRNAMKDAENQAWLKRDAAQRQAASQRARFGASGIEVNEGSPLNVLADIDAQGEVDAAGALHQGKMQKMQWDVRKSSAKQQGRTALFGTLTTLADPLDWAKTSRFKDNFSKSGGGGFWGGS